MKKIFLTRLLFPAAFLVMTGVPEPLFAKEEQPFAAASSIQEKDVFEPEPTKLLLTDATPVNPGQVEWVNSYTVAGAAKQWQTDGRRTGRRLYRESAFETQANIGILEDLDIGVTQGFAITTDKENNYDETGGAVDAAGMSLDATEGPHHGHGLSDLTLNARWVFLKSRDETLRLAYIPSVIVPTGRRSNLDHLGPSQGYVSMGNLLAVTKDINRWTMSGNLGYEVPLASRGRTDSAAGTWTTGFAAGWHVLRWFQPEAGRIKRPAVFSRSSS